INVPAGALLSNGIIKGFTVTDAATGGFNLATASGGANAVIAAFNSYVTTLGGNLATDNVLLTSSPASLPAGTDPINSLLLRGDGINVSGAVGAILSVASGTVASSGGTTTGNSITLPTL